MAIIEINSSNILFQGSDLDSMRYDRMGAECVYRFLLSLGAMRDVKLMWDEESGKISILKSIYLENFPNATQNYSLANYIKLLIRWDKSAYNRMKNVEKKIAKMEAIPKGLRAQLKN